MSKNKNRLIFICYTCIRFYYMITLISESQSENNLHQFFFFAKSIFDISHYTFTLKAPRFSKLKFNFNRII